jgi:hypothetical protein
LKFFWLKISTIFTNNIINVQAIKVPLHKCNFSFGFMGMDLSLQDGNEEFIVGGSILVGCVR